MSATPDIRRASYPRFRREGEPPRIELTQDDVCILQHVYRHRFIRAEDLQRLLNSRSKDRLSRRLTLLYRAGFLDRPIAQVDRYKQGGSQSFVYGLDTKGARYLKEAHGFTIGGADWRSRNRFYTRENLDHTLAVTRFMVDLEIACRERPDLSLITFEEIIAAAPEETRRSRNPMSWQVPVQWHGGRVVVNIAPDAIFGLRIVRTDGKALRSYFFLEMDRGTMTIVPSESVRESDAFPYRATILRKLLTYADSYRLKLHSERFGIKTPRILLVTSGKPRAEAISTAITQFVARPLNLPEAMFVVSSDETTQKCLEIFSGAEVAL